MHLFYWSHWPRFLQVSRMVLVVSMMLAIFQLPAQAQGKECHVKHPTFYHTIQVDGLSIFYREAGPKDAPTVLLLLAKVAMGRRLAIRLYWMWRNGCEYSPSLEFGSYAGQLGTGHGGK